MLSAEIDYLHGRKESIFIYQETVQKSEMVDKHKGNVSTLAPTLTAPDYILQELYLRYYSKARNDSCVKAKDVLAGCLGDDLTCWLPR